MQSSQPHSSIVQSAGDRWALVLAGGEGSRLQSLTTLASGLAVPKQFCSFGGGPSLLNDALKRASVIAPPERACAIVSEHHARWWQSLPMSLPSENLIVQPCNRGTAIGILLPLLQILHRDPGASLVVLPSDHYVRNEAVLANSLRTAMREVERRNERIVLLGLTPEDADPELGYIVPMGEGGPAAREVGQFIEKPSAVSAKALIERGGLWNSFIFAARGQTLLRAFEARCPDVVESLRHVISSGDGEATERANLAAVYERVPCLDFSRDVLETSLRYLTVAAVPPCGWSDLGTPRRVAETFTRYASSFRSQAAALVETGGGFVDLAAHLFPVQGAFGLQESPR
jgi:mannose-1-phosphate guanylyltransferase